MIRFDDYKGRFKYVRLERTDGILEVTIHRNGGVAIWEAGERGIHYELGEAFYFIGRDSETKVMIFTGAGDAFIERMDMSAGQAAMTSEFWFRMYKEGKDLLMNLLDIEVPIVGALNGNAFIHAELIALSDIIVAAEGAKLADKAHFVNGVPPADGVHVVWPMLLGPNRARHFLMTGAEIDAAEAQRLGIVAEVVPKIEVLKRARAIARDLAQKPPLMLRYSRAALTQDIKRRLLDDLGYGLALEGLGVRSLTN